MKAKTNDIGWYEFDFEDDDVASPRRSVEAASRRPLLFAVAVVLMGVALAMAVPGVLLMRGATTLGSWARACGWE